MERNYSKKVWWHYLKAKLGDEQRRYYFKVGMPSGSLVNTVSVSVFLDSTKNENDSLEYLLTLVGPNNKMISDTSLGYDDMKKFDTLDEVLGELIRLGYTKV